jgi:GT2 family glycosyltransferase
MDAMTQEPEVTLVVTPREKFSACRDSLDSILADAGTPYRLVYVDGGSPGPVRRMIEDRARRHGFEHLRVGRHLTPNRARLMGLARVRTPWTVFIDNDVVVSPGWLGTLLRCGQESGAAAVSPLICQGRPLHSIVHCAGGECGVKEIATDEGVERHLHERIARQGRKVADVRAKLVRGPTGLAEFHCVLVRTEAARAPGMIDPEILNTREHIDFCMNVRAAGGEIWLEPDSLVTYLHDAPIGPSDLPYYMLRWSDGWERRSLQHLIAKWGLTTKGTAGYRLGTVGWRRRQYLVSPFAERVAAMAPDGVARRAVRRVVMGGERRINALLCALHERGERKDGAARPPG